MKDHTFGRICRIGLVPWAWFKEEQVYHFSIKKNEHKRRFVLPKPEMS